jgi:L-2-hydroxyglutarate oxidase LhgO
MKIDVAVIGAGVIGLSIARQLAQHNPALRIVVLEKEAAVGTGISSRSSEVIHAGLYYPASYLKSALCVRGRDLLYRYCDEHGVPQRKVGKLVVANTDDEHEFLHALAFRAELNGVVDLQWLDRRQIQVLEPAIQAKGAFLSPSTGIIDSAALLRCLEKEIIDIGVTLCLRARVERITRAAGGFVVHCIQATDKFLLGAQRVINCAGLQATQVARHIDGFPAGQLPDLVLAKGSYFSYRGSNPISRLVYPVPVSQPARSSEILPQGLGIHATLDMQGQLRFGPDIEIVPTENYGVDEGRRALFADIIRRYFPALDEQRLHAAYAGIRPRLVTRDGKTADFLVQTEAQHNVPGLTNLFGIESPGLTSCFAMAEHVCALQSGLH